MWMEEKTGKRINIARFEQALPHAPQTIATACPYCATMMSDAAKALERDDAIVRDIAELVAEALVQTPQAGFAAPTITADATRTAAEPEHR
jgi:Fe-S oxidoreductase